MSDTKAGAVFTSGPWPETTGLTEGGLSGNIRHLDGWRSTKRFHNMAERNHGSYLFILPNFKYTVRYTP